MSEDKIITDSLEQKIVMMQWDIDDLSGQIKVLEREAFPFRGLIKSLYSLLIDLCVMGIVSFILLWVLVKIFPILAYGWEMLIGIVVLIIVLYPIERSVRDDFTHDFEKQPKTVKAWYWTVRIIGQIFIYWLFWFHPYIMALFYHDVTATR